MPEHLLVRRSANIGARERPNTDGMGATAGTAVTFNGGASAGLLAENNCTHHEEDLHEQQMQLLQDFSPRNRLSELPWT